MIWNNFIICSLFSHQVHHVIAQQQINPVINEPICDLEERPSSFWHPQTRGMSKFLSNKEHQVINQFYDWISFIQIQNSIASKETTTLHPDFGSAWIQASRHFPGQKWLYTSILLRSFSRNCSKKMCLESYYDDDLIQTPDLLKFLRHVGRHHHFNNWNAQHFRHIPTKIQ